MSLLANAWLRDEINRRTMAVYHEAAGAHAETHRVLVQELGYLGTLSRLVRMHQCYARETVWDDDGNPTYHWDCKECVGGEWPCPTIRTVAETVADAKDYLKWFTVTAEQVPA